MVMLLAGGRGAVGAKPAWSSDLGPAALTPFQVPLARQEFWEMAKGPVMVTLLSDTPAEPVLVICTSCAALVAPAVSESNDRLAGATETEATGAAPATATGNALPSALMLTAPAAAPAAVGARLT